MASKYEKAIAVNELVNRVRNELGDGGSEFKCSLVFCNERIRKSFTIVIGGDDVGEVVIPSCVGLINSILDIYVEKVKSDAREEAMDVICKLDNKEE